MSMRTPFDVFNEHVFERHPSKATPIKNITSTSKTMNKQIDTDTFPGLIESNSNKKRESNMSRVISASTQQQSLSSSSNVTKVPFKATSQATPLVNLLTESKQLIIESKSISSSLELLVSEMEQIPKQRKYNYQTQFLQSFEHQLKNFQEITDKPLNKELIEKLIHNIIEENIKNYSIITNDIKKFEKEIQEIKQEKHEMIQKLSGNKKNEEEKQIEFNQVIKFIKTSKLSLDQQKEIRDSTPDTKKQFDKLNYFTRVLPWLIDSLEESRLKCDTLEKNILDEHYKKIGTYCKLANTVDKNLFHKELLDYVNRLSGYIIKAHIKRDEYINNIMSVGTENVKTSKNDNGNLNYKQELSKLKEEYENKLKEQSNQYDKNKLELEKEYNLLKEQIVQSDKIKKDLKSTIDQLRTENDIYKNRTNTMEKDINELRQKENELKKLNNNLTVKAEMTSDICKIINETGVAITSKNNEINELLKLFSVKNLMEAVGKRQKEKQKEQTNSGKINENSSSKKRSNSSNTDNEENNNNNNDKNKKQKTIINEENENMCD